MQVCFATGGKNPFPNAKADQMIELHQTGFDRFTVYYGLSKTTHTSYAKAAQELGACIMHLAACEGRLDNRTISEARIAGDARPYFSAQCQPHLAD